MKKFVINGQIQNEPFFIVIYHFSLVKAARNAAGVCKLRNASLFNEDPSNEPISAGSILLDSTFNVHHYYITILQKVKMFVKEQIEKPSVVLNSTPDCRLYNVERV